MNFVTKLIILCLPLTLMSCSYLSKSSGLQNRDKEYLAAKSIPPLKTPPGISSDAFHNAYPVSDRQYPEPSNEVSLVPPGLNG